LLTLQSGKEQKHYRCSADFQMIITEISFCLWFGEMKPRNVDKISYIQATLIANIVTTSGYGVAFLSLHSMHPGKISVPHL
jgi:hypothetical protein